MYNRSRSKPAAGDDVGSLVGNLHGAAMSDFTGNPGGNNECTHHEAHVLTNVGAFRITAPPQYGGGTWTQWHNTFQILRSGYCSWPSEPIPAPPVVEVMSALKTDVCDHIREAGRSSFHAISFIREMESTIGMLKNPFKLLDFVRKHATKKAKRGTFKNALKSAHTNVSGRAVIDRAADTWLEGIYGWNPFVGDCSSLLDFAKRALRERRAMLREPETKFSFSRKRAVDVTLEPTSWSSTQPYRIAMYRRKTVTRGEYYGSFKVNPSLQSESFLQSVARGLNLDRLGYAAWDAVPYSFVVDWFTDIGDRLDDALSGPAFYTYANPPWLSLRTEDYFYAHVETTPGAYDPYWGKFSGTGVFAEKARSFDRHPASLDDISLSGASGMHGQRVASGLALSWGVIRRLW